MSDQRILEAAERLKSLTLKYVEHQKTGKALQLEIDIAKRDLGHAIMGERWENVQSWLTPFNGF